MISRGRPKDCPYVYREADKYVDINDGDRDLEPIRLRLPMSPSYYLIDGYGLPPEEQYFKRLKTPDRLQEVERDARKRMMTRVNANKNLKPNAQMFIKYFWEVFDERRKPMYDEMVEWLKEVYWMREHGYWFFNNGRPTYITGDHFDYLNFWTFPDVKANDGHPEYRDEDRKRYIFRQYAELTTESVTIQDGKYQVKDIGARTCYGTAEPKFRRCGITTQALHKGAKVVMSDSGTYATIVSMEGDSAEDHWKLKTLPALLNYPIWLIPMYSGSIQKGITFDVDSNIAGDEVLRSTYDYTDSAGERKKDGGKIHFALMDEEGKTMVAKVLERHSVYKLAMSLGGGSEIIGFSIHPTTVEEMDVGGEEYRRLCQSSKFYDRGENGQTDSGLFEMFVPADRGQQGFIDRFGMSVMGTPTEEQMRLRPDAMFAKLKMGARVYLQQQLDSLLAKGTPEALELYRSLRRKLPMSYADCWLGSSGDMGFDMEIIDNRIAELRRKSKVRVGRFEWTNGFGSDVRFEDDPDGQFEISKVLLPEEANQRMRVSEVNPVTGEWVEHWAPRYPYRFTASADPFKSGTSNEAKKMGTHSRQSDGGLAVLWEHDEKIDESNNMRDWDSFRFVCSYRYRPESLRDYQEDALKMCIYFGAPIYPERNVGDMDICFTEMGYGGYYLYDIDPRTGARAEKPGFASYEKQKGNLFSSTKDYIRYRGHKEEHISYLEEVKGIQGVEQMNKYDRFTAHGGCLLGSKQNYYNLQREGSTKHEEGDLQSIVDFFTGIL